MSNMLDNKGRVVKGKLMFVCPGTGEAFGEIQVTSPAEIEQHMLELRASKKAWGNKELKARIKVLRKLYRVIFQEMDAITLTITRDTGKPRQDALIEVFTVLNYLNTTLNKAPSWLKEERVSTGLQFFKRAYKKHKPYGVVAVISPWNYPFTLAMNPILGALIAGNSVMVKASEMTPAVGALMESLFKRVPELAACIRFVHGDGKAGAQVVNSNPDLIYVTGSVRTGQLISKAAADDLIPVICELGGKDPMIVLDDADLNAAARWGCWGAFSNSGQTCMSPERVYVMSDVFDDFVAAAVREAKALQLGYSESVDAKNQYGTITSPKQLEIVKAHVEDALSKGATLHCGGSHEGMLWQPTVMTGIRDDMLLMQEETFGAVMPIIKVETELEAIEKANASEFGLSASVFSEHPARARRVAEALEVGSVNINDTMSHYGIAELPFGGVKKSGAGRANGPEALLDFTYPVSYVYGKPSEHDIATKLRAPGNYEATKAALKALIGPSIRQKSKGLVGLLKRRR